MDFFSPSRFIATPYPLSYYRHDFISSAYVRHIRRLALRPFDSFSVGHALKYSSCSLSPSELMIAISSTNGSITIAKPISFTGTPSMPSFWPDPDAKSHDKEHKNEPEDEDEKEQELTGPVLDLDEDLFEPIMPEVFTIYSEPHPRFRSRGGNVRVCFDPIDSDLLYFWYGGLHVHNLRQFSTQTQKIVSADDDPYVNPLVDITTTPSRPGSILIAQQDTVKLWDIRSDKSLLLAPMRHMISRTGSAIQRIAWNPMDSMQFATLDCAPHVHIWDLRFSASDAMLTLPLFDPIDAVPIDSILDTNDANSPAPFSLQYSPDGLLLMATQVNNVSTFDTTTFHLFTTMGYCQHDNCPLGYPLQPCIDPKVSSSKSGSYYCIMALPAAAGNESVPGSSNVEEEEEEQEDMYYSKLHICEIGSHVNKTSGEAIRFIGSMPTGLNNIYQGQQQKRQQCVATRMHEKYDAIFVVNSDCSVQVHR